MAEENEFEPHLGRPRSRGGAKARRYLGRVLAAANLARGGARLSGARSRPYAGSRHGKGAGVGRMLSAGGRGGTGHRRVVIKASIVKLAGRGAGAAAAHLRYLQRDGTTREGAAGSLYDRENDVAGRAGFHGRCEGDRHQFRFIVSAEDGDQYDDLKPLTRRLMAQVERDLGTRLDWVAVDHFNTAHPHTHIVVRGKDEHAADLVIAKDYLTKGLRERAIELVDLDLGPRTPIEIEARLRAEMSQDRLTSIDRALLRRVDVDRSVSALGRSAFDQTLRAGRLAHLARLGLAEPIGGGRWRLNETLESTLRTMGERGDIIRTMQRELRRGRIDRAPSDRAIFSPGSEGVEPLIGRVVARGLEDEHADRHYLIVDALDGRAHYVRLGKGEHVEPLREGMVVRVEPLRVEIREVDRTVAAVAAANGGRYDVDAHLRHDPSATQTFAESHVRRLEAMRRGQGAVERQPSGTWVIADDHLDRVEKWQTAQLRRQPISVEILSPEPIQALGKLQAVTWLDRREVDEDLNSVRDAGFGHEVRMAFKQRRQWLIAEGLAEDIEGAFHYRPDALAILQRREVQRVSTQVAEELGKPFVEPQLGSRIEGIVGKPIDLVSGRFSVIERSRDFTLVPWRPVLDKQLGRSVSGIARENGISWSIARSRGGPSRPW